MLLSVIYWPMANVVDNRPIDSAGQMQYDYETCVYTRIQNFTVCIVYLS